MTAKNAARKASRHILALALSCFLIACLGNASLDMNAYGEVVNVSKTTSTESAPVEGATENSTKGSIEEAAEDKTITKTSPDGATSDVDPTQGEDGAETKKDRASEMGEAKATPTEKSLEVSDSAEVINGEYEDGSGVEEKNSEDDVEGTVEKKTADAIVYVFNRDDDKLTVTLFIDSDLKDTEDISKDKEEKFGTYPLDVGPHKFKIAWWDDDTKKGHENVTVVNLEEDEAITLYTVQNEEPEEYEVNVQVRNDNDVDLDAYLYIDGEYEKQKEIKKTSTTDLGKFDLEEGTHVLAIRWQDPDTKVEYEKRKTIEVDGKDAVIFYAPKGISFEAEDANDASKTTRYTSSTGSTSSTAKSSKVASTSSKTSSSTSKDESDDSKEDGSREDASKSDADSKDESDRESDLTEASDKRALSASSSSTEKVLSSAQTAEKSSMENVNGISLFEPEDGDLDEVGPIDRRFYVTIAALILAIYLIFFRR